MREILFRGKRIDNGEWVEGYYFITPLTDENSGTTPDVGWFFLAGIKRHCISVNGVVYVVDGNTVSQYTGLKDKNGNKIFEGSIVRILYTDWGSKSPNDQRTMEQYLRDIAEIKAVVWDYNGFYVSDKIHYPATMEYGKYGYIEIIGNIHDNPELLEDKWTLS